MIPRTADPVLDVRRMFPFTSGTSHSLRLCFQSIIVHGTFPNSKCLLFYISNHIISYHIRTIYYHLERFQMLHLKSDTVLFSYLKVKSLRPLPPAPHTVKYNK